MELEGPLDTVDDLKKLIQDVTEVPADSQKIIFKGIYILRLLKRKFSKATIIIIVVSHPPPTSRVHNKRGKRPSNVPIPNV